MYCPPGFLDGEDGGGNVINGSWRQEVDGASCALEPLRQAGGAILKQLPQSEIYFVIILVLPLAK